MLEGLNLLAGWASVSWKRENKAETALKHERPAQNRKRKQASLKDWRFVSCFLGLENEDEMAKRMTRRLVYQGRDLGCPPLRLEYDFVAQQGKLFLQPGHCVDHDATITLFTAIDPKVMVIRTFAGQERDTAYYRGHSTGGEWKVSRSGLVAAPQQA